MQQLGEGGGLILETLVLFGGITVDIGSVHGIPIALFMVGGNRLRKNLLQGGGDEYQEPHPGRGPKAVGFGHRHNLQSTGGRRNFLVAAK